jgi:hypothetical protein
VPFPHHPTNPPCPAKFYNLGTDDVKFLIAGTALEEIKDMVTLTEGGSEELDKCKCGPATKRCQEGFLKMVFAQRMTQPHCVRLCLPRIGHTKPYPAAAMLVRRGDPYPAADVWRAGKRINIPTATLA